MRLLSTIFCANCSSSSGRTAVLSCCTYWPRLSVQHQEDGAHGRAVMCRMGDLKYTMRLYEKDELYDLSKDPDEQVNVIDDPSYLSAILEFQKTILRWYQETVDWVPDRKDKR